LRKPCHAFGRDLGIAFQLQDDYLDAFGDPETFGKQVGGDIIENKKTFLYLTALHHSEKEKAAELVQLFSSAPENPDEKIAIVKEQFIASGAAAATQQEIKNYTQRAFSHLDNLQITEENKEILREFGRNLMNRTF